VTNFFLLLQRELWESWANCKVVIVFSSLIAISIAAPYIDYNSLYRVFVASENFSYPELLRYFYIFLELILIVFIPFMVMGTVASEVKNSSAASLLVKPVGRAGYILSKYLMYMLIFGIPTTIAMVLSAFLANTLALEPYSLSRLGAPIGLAWVFISFAVSFVMLISTITNRQVVAGAIGLSVLLAGFAFSYAPGINEFFPSSLFAWMQNILNPPIPPVVQNALDPSPAWRAFNISLISSVVCILVSILIIRRKEL